MDEVFRMRSPSCLVWGQAIDLESLFCGGWEEVLSDRIELRVGGRELM